jgi:hypothetical protein
MRRRRAERRSNVPARCTGFIVCPTRAWPRSGASWWLAGLGPVILKGRKADKGRDFQVVLASFRAACERLPKAAITLRHGAGFSRQERNCPPSRSLSIPHTSRALSPILQVHQCRRVMPRSSVAGKTHCNKISRWQLRLAGCCGRNERPRLAVSPTGRDLPQRTAGGAS